MLFTGNTFLVMQKLSWLSNLITLEGLLVAEWEGIKEKSNLH